jgi:hypothetical protein
MIRLHHIRNMEQVSLCAPYKSKKTLIIKLSHNRDYKIGDERAEAISY